MTGKISSNMLAVVISVVGLWLSFLENIFHIFLNEVSLFNGNYYHYLLKIYLKDENVKISP